MRAEALVPNTTCRGEVSLVLSPVSAISGRLCLGGFRSQVRHFHRVFTIEYELDLLCGGIATRLQRAQRQRVAVVRSDVIGRR